jgi:hypothetical protein
MAMDKRISTKTTGRNRPRPPSPRYTYGEGLQLIRLDVYSGADGNMAGSQVEALDELKVTTGDSAVGMDASGGLAHGNRLRLTGTETMLYDSEAALSRANRRLHGLDGKLAAIVHDGDGLAGQCARPVSDTNPAIRGPLPRDDVARSGTATSPCTARRPQGRLPDLPDVRPAVMVPPSGWSALAA